MGDAVFLNVDLATYQQFEQIRQQLNEHTREPQSKVLGAVLSDVACQILEKVFIELLIQQKQKLSTTMQKQIDDSDKVIERVLEAITKYLPWSISLFNNDRLLPMVNYFHELVRVEHDKVYVHYPLDSQMVKHALAIVHQVQQNDMEAIPPAFDALIKMIDTGVTHLIRKPKHLLKFNLVVDKTLNGVIHVTTQAGYKRLERLATQIDLNMAHDYIEHFLKFLRSDSSLQENRDS